VVNGKYEILSPLGEGGMGVVYKVRHLLLPTKNIFALKILRPRFSQDDEFRNRFLREAELTMELTHENIIQVRDFGMTEDGQLFFTMDYFPGRTLKDFITERGPLEPSRAVDIASEILQALGEAHRLGIVHRDLKPDNVLVAAPPDGPLKVRVLDFGIAKLVEGGNDARTLTGGQLIGTPKYMAPEQASGESVDCRADLYSLGIILYEMLSGRVPFPGGTARSIIMNQLTAPPPPLRAACPGLALPAPLERLVLDLLAKDPAERPGSAEEVLGTLRGETTVRRTSRRRRRRAAYRRLTYAAFIAGASLLALEHFRPWRWFFLSDAEAEGEGKEGNGKRTGAPRHRRPAGSRRLRCEVCGAVCSPGEKVGDMCHGLPLVELD
jgi:serine/threonine-protein kinase